MKIIEALEALREDLSDTKPPYLWSDARLIGWLDQAQREAARRAHLFLDSITPDICRINLVAGKSQYGLDPRVIRVDRVKLASKGPTLAKMFRRDLDATVPGWEDLTGPVVAYCQDYSSGIFRPYRTPEAADTVNLTVIREPLYPITLDDLEKTFELAPRYHETLLHWPAYRAYSNPDSEKKNDALAKMHLALFEEEFGQRSSAKNEAWEVSHHGENDLEGLS